MVETFLNGIKVYRTSCMHDRKHHSVGTETYGTVFSRQSIDLLVGNSELTLLTCINVHMFGKKSYVWSSYFEIDYFFRIFDHTWVFVRVLEDQEKFQII